MAKNRVFANGRFLNLTVSTADAAASSDYESGKPIMVNTIPGVCETDMDSDNKVTIDTGGVYKLSVFRPSTVGDGRVGSLVFWDSTGRRPALPSGTTAVPSTGSQPFGVILDSIAAADSSAETTGVRVKLISPSQLQSATPST